MRKERLRLMILIVMAFFVRLGVISFAFDNLSEDRDAYLAIAHHLASGDGYRSVDGGTPTAFRPPLYPFVLSVLFRYGGGTVSVAILHLLLGTATVYLTLILGRRLKMGRWADVAAALVVIDPLLNGYATFVMTETLFAFLVALLMVVSVEPTIKTGQDGGQPQGRNQAESPMRQGESHLSDSLSDQLSEGGPSSCGGSRWRLASLGLMFGLSALCRPTIWVYGFLGILAWSVLGGMLGQRSFRGRLASVSRPACWLVLLTAMLTVLPWLTRNWIVLGQPIVTTTHGGYTLLLGNNPTFYREVVARPWGTVWSGESLTNWQETLENDMREAVPPVTSEVERDRWMYRRAWHNIAADPLMFLDACWLRFRRFWNVAPLGPIKDLLPLEIRRGMVWYYGIITAGMLVALCRMTRLDGKLWRPVILLLISFTLVHLVYWTNMRMRTPIVPEIALLAVRGTKSGTGAA